MPDSGNSSYIIKVNDVRTALDAGKKTRKGIVLDWEYFADLIKKQRDKQVKELIKKETDFAVGVIKKHQLRAKTHYEYALNYIFFYLLEPIGRELGDWNYDAINKSSARPEAEYIWDRIDNIKIRRHPDKIGTFLAWLWRDHTKVAAQFYKDIGLQPPVPTSNITDTIVNPPEFTAEQWLNPNNQEHLPFFEREKELQSLDDFAAHPDLFKIWVISGPSGAGKTRLYSKWMYDSTAVAEWDKRVLKADDKDTEYWRTWTPTQSTLIVIDYMFGFGEVIQQIIRRGQDNHPHKIRLLVIDHIFPKDLRQLLNDPCWGFSGMSGTGFDAIIPLFFNQSPLDVSQTEDQDELIRKIITYLAGSKVNKAAIEEAEQYLKALPKAWHPLFAALVGDALREGKPYQSWNRRDLIHYYLEGSEPLPWKRGDTQGQWAACMIAAATARRGASFLLLTDCVPENKEILAEGYAPIKDICKRIVSSSSEHELPPFEPDLLGESFFLLFLQYLEHNGSRQAHVKFIEMLSAGGSDTQIKDALNFVGFIERLVRNLSNDDQNDEQTKNFWKVLLEFLNPAHFPSGSYMEWAISAAIVTISKEAKPHDKIDYKSLLERIDAEVLYQVTAKELLNTSALKSIEYNAIVHGHTEGTIQEIPENMLRLLVRTHIETGEIQLSNICSASQSGDLETVKLIVASGGAADDALEDGLTPLILASQEGHIDVVRWLLDNKANPNLATFDEGKTALLLASLEGYENIVAMLIGKKANVNHASKNGITPLMAASHAGHVRITKLLLSEEANIDQEALYKQTALLIACAAGHANVAEILIQEGADISHKDKNGATALMYAARNGHANVVKLFIKEHIRLMGAGMSDPNIFQNILKSAGLGWERAFSLAQAHGHAEVEKMLSQDFSET